MMLIHICEYLYIYDMCVCVCCQNLVCLSKHQRMRQRQTHAFFLLPNLTEFLWAFME